MDMDIQSYISQRKIHVDILDSFWGRYNFIIWKKIKTREKELFVFYEVIYTPQAPEKYQ